MKVDFGIEEHGDNQHRAAVAHSDERQPSVNSRCAALSRCLLGAKECGFADEIKSPRRHRASARALVVRAAVAGLARHGIRSGALV
jgi:hypothetical protein